MRSWTSRLGLVLVLLAMANFLAFFVVSMRIGGDALNGQVRDGRYFVANHGRLTEVSSSLWHVSKYHAISVFITTGIGIFVGGGLLASGKIRSRSQPR